MDEQLKPYESLQCWRDLVANITWWRAPRWNILWPTPRWQTCWRASKCRPGKSPIFATRRVWTGRCRDGDGDGGGVQLYKIGFLQIPDASNKCSATKQKLVNFPWKRLLERCVPALVPRFHNFSGVGDKNWVQLRPLEHNLIFIEDLGWIGQLDVKSWDRTGMTIHQLSIFQPRSQAACKRVSKINKYGQFHDCRYLWWEVSELEFCSRDGYLSPVQISPS